jgi:hypothetical protein
MKIKVTAIINLLTALTGVVFGIPMLGYGIFDGGLHTAEMVSIGLLCLIGATSIVLYTIWTKGLHNQELYNIEHKNKMLQKQIEQKELLKKLEDTSN